MAEKKSIANLEKELSSSDEKTIMKGLKSIKSKGDINLIPKLLELSVSASPKIRRESQDVLNSLKQTASLPVLMKAVRQDQKHLRSVIEAVWNSGIDPQDVVGELCELTCEVEDYECFVELYSLVMEFDGEWQEEQVMDAILAFKNLLAREEDAPYKVLLMDMIERLESINERL